MLKFKLDQNEKCKRIGPTSPGKISGSAICDLFFLKQYFFSEAYFQVFISVLSSFAKISCSLFQLILVSFNSLQFFRGVDHQQPPKKVTVT